MLRYSIFFIFLLSCTQSFIEETQDMVHIDASASYDASDVGILLEWKSQWDFVNVEVLRGSSSTDLQQYRSKIAQTTLMDEETIAGQDYYYQINAYNSRGRQIGASSVHKGKRSYRPFESVEVPANLHATQRVYSDKIELLWTGNPADRFRIYRSDSTAKSFTRLAEVGFGASDELKYIDSAVQPAKIYFYKISVVGKDGDNVKEKYATDTIKGETLDAPVGIKASTDSPGSIFVSWTKDKSVDYYKLYRSTTANGDYVLVAPFVADGHYLDVDLPSVEGELIDGKYVYPSYFYKVQSIKCGTPSGLSASAQGSAINPIDFLEAPELNLVLNKSVYPYTLDLSWSPLAVSDVTYKLLEINEIQQTNVIFDSTTESSINVEVGAFNSRITYELRPINNKVGGILGNASTKSFRNTIPEPPTIATITTNASHEVVEQVTTPNKDMFNYYYYKPFWGSGKNYTINVGKIEEEWLITPQVGYIELTWTKPVGASVDIYKVSRRKQGTSEWKVVANVSGMTETKFTFKDSEFVAADFEGTGNGDSFKYPMYEYQLVAIFNNQESAASAIVSGSAINPADILPAPNHVSIPGHWASGIGFTGSKWRTGENSPPDANLIYDKGGVNHLYLVWGEVVNAGDYRVRHSIGDTKENWVENKSRFPHAKNNVTRFQWFNNETTSVEYTALYESGDFTGYVRNAAAFDVAAVNRTKGGVVGQSRAILFREPESSPF